MVASSSAFEGLSSVVQSVYQFLLWSVSRVPVIFEHARLVFVSFKRDSSARLCSDVLTNVARTFFTSCMQVHCSFLFSGIIRFLMQELLALAGLSRCRVWKVTVEEFYSWQRLHYFSFRNRFLDMNRFFSFLGKSKLVQG